MFLTCGELSKERDTTYVGMEYFVKWKHYISDGEGDMLALGITDEVFASVLMLH